jgi:hypothetical protein
LKEHEKHYGNQKKMLLFALVITDGEALDGSQFEEHLLSLHGKVFVIVVVLGWGAEHDKTVGEYKRIAQTHRHLKVVIVRDAEHQGREIAKALRGFWHAEDPYSHTHEVKALAPLASPLTRTTPESQGSLCSVCQSQLSTYLIVPCGHVCVCRECAEKVTACPQCGRLKEVAQSFYQ